MVFHRFQQLPFELRLQIWEFALDHTFSIDGLTDEQKRVCHMVSLNASSGSPFLTKLLTFEHSSLAYVCRESQQVLRRCRGRLYKARDYIPSTDVLYLDDFESFVNLSQSLRFKIRHIALPADLCYNMLKRDTTSLNALHQYGWPCGLELKFLIDLDPDFIDLPSLESMTIVLPPLEKSMPYYADHFHPAVCLPSSLRIVTYSEIQRIRIRGHRTYTSWLRGSANTKRRFLGPFVKDVNEVFVPFFSFDGSWHFIFWNVPE